MIAIGASKDALKDDFYEHLQLDMISSAEEADLRLCKKIFAAASGSWWGVIWPDNLICKTEIKLRSMSLTISWQFFLYYCPFI